MKKVITRWICDFCGKEEDQYEGEQGPEWIELSCYEPAKVKHHLCEMECLYRWARHRAGQ